MVSQNFKEFARWSFLAWGLYFLTFQFWTNLLLHEHGFRLSWTAYYWLIEIAILGYILLAFLKYNHPLVQISSIPFFGVTGYMFARFLISEYWEMVPGLFLINCFCYLIMFINLISFMIGLIENIKNKKIFTSLKHLKQSRVFKLLGVFSIIWVGLFAGAYFGYGDTVKISDTDEDQLSIICWNDPFGSLNYSNYLKAGASDILDILGDMNASIIKGVSAGSLTQPQTKSNYTAVFNEWAAHDIGLIIDISVGNFMGYNYLDEFVESIDAVMDYVEAEGFTNFEGVSIDVEGPTGGVEFPINKTLYHESIRVIQDKFDELKERFPGARTNLIQMAGILFDFFDGDPDLNVKSLTSSTPPMFDNYGYMTYFLNPSPKQNTYSYNMLMEIGYQQHGYKFQPWVGWIYGRDEIDESPVLLEDSLTQFKIAKSYGFKEIAIAPIRNWVTTNYTRGLEILTMFKDIYDDGFADFEINVVHDQRLFTDFPLYIEKITPFYFLPESNVFRDLLMNFDGGVIMWVQLAIFLQIIFVKYITSNPRKVQKILNVKN